jgi:hypothetical protein
MIVTGSGLDLGEWEFDPEANRPNYIRFNQSVDTEDSVVQRRAGCPVVRAASVALVLDGETTVLGSGAARVSYVCRDGDLIRRSESAVVTEFLLGRSWGLLDQI